MEADVGHAQFGHLQFEGTVCSLGCDAVSGLICEYQTGLFVEILVVFSVGILFCLLFFSEVPPQREQ